MPADLAESERLAIGRVISGTLQVVGRHFTPFFALAFAVVGVPSILASMPHLAADPQTDTLARQVLVSLVSIPTTAILRAALASATMADLSDRPPQIGQSLVVGLRAALPVIGASLVIGLGVGVGLIALVVPGIIFACATSVTVPAMIAERRGVFAAISRSLALTRGDRWRIFVLWLAYVAMLFGVVLVLSFVTALVAVATGDTTGEGPIALIAAGLASTLISLAGATGATVLYVHLRQAREGGGGWLSEVFD